ncbi:MAG TPA: aquaporin [Candidatus Saccharimonadales bacterium]
MATKKAASAAKKSGNKKPVAKKQATTKVTTVKAVESSPVETVATAAPQNRRRTLKFGLNRTPLLGAMVAEFIGTFILAGAVIAGQGQPILVFFALVGVVLTVGTISGGYVNPALVVGAWVTRRMDGMRAVAYIVAQVLGAMLALVVLDAYVNNAPANSASLYGSAATLFKAAAIPHSKEWFLFLSEFLGTIIFGFAVAGATREKKERTAAALTVGLGAFLGLMIAGSSAALLGGTSVLNPAVAVALQAVSFSSVWPVMVYVVGAALGGVIGFVAYDLVRGTGRAQDEETA